MRTMILKFKNVFQLCVIVFLGFLFLDCDFNIFKPDQEEYFPVSVGNTWTFNSIYKDWYYNFGGSSRNHYEGVEIWEILANNGDTLTLEISFNGYSYFLVYYEDCDLYGGPYLDSILIDVRKVIELIPQDSYWKYTSTTESNISFNKIPGLMLIKDSGIPYKINSNELVVRDTIYDTSYDQSGDITGYLYWDIKLHQGPIFGKRLESTSYWNNNQSIELLSYSLNE